MLTRPDSANEPIWDLPHKPQWGKQKQQKKAKRFSFLKPCTKYMRSFANGLIFWIH